MKKFQYSLETVLRFKQQVLDRRKEEYAARLLLVRRKQQEIEELEQSLREYEAEFETLKRKGASAESFLLYAGVIERTVKQIRAERERLERLERYAEEKKAELLEANIDTLRYEKLKSRKQEEYRFQEQKEQELFLEEFVKHPVQ